MWMRTGIRIEVSPSDKDRLEAIVAARGSPQKHVWRARIILLTQQGLGTLAIMAATGKSKTCVWRWQERFMAEGVGKHPVRAAGHGGLLQAPIGSQVFSARVG